MQTPDKTIQKLLDQEGQNDACDLGLWPLDPQSWLFYILAMWTTNKQASKQANKQTNK